MLRSLGIEGVDVTTVITLNHVEASPTVKAVPEYVAASVAHVRQRRPSGRENYIALVLHCLGRSCGRSLKFITPAP